MTIDDRLPAGGTTQLEGRVGRAPKEMGPPAMLTVGRSALWRLRPPVAVISGRSREKMKVMTIITKIIPAERNKDSLQKPT